VVPALREALSDRNSDIRVSAAESLWRIEPAASAAVPDLEKLLNDADASVSNAAREALEIISQDKP